MNRSIDMLLKQVPPPQTTSSVHPDDWLEVERQLGLQLPEDYKRIVEVYGDYQWSDFLFLLNPFSPNTYLNLLTRHSIILDAERQSRQQFPEHYPLALFPEPGGLLPLLITDNGDVGFWITQAAPEKWPILVKGARPPEFEVHFIRTTTFLYRFAAGRFQSLVLPSFDEE